MDGELKTIYLSFGAHTTREDGMCLMEAVAFLAGEPHSDRPECACPVIGRIARTLNDSCNDDERQSIIGALQWRIVGTKSTPEIERQRAMMAIAMMGNKLSNSWLSAHLSLQRGDFTNAAFWSVLDVLHSHESRLGIAELLDRMIRLTEPQEASVVSAPKQAVTAQ